MENKLDIAKRIVKENIDDARCGIFNCSNWTGDPMKNLYIKDGLRIDICYSYSYFEVFGLDSEDYILLESFYYDLLRN